MAGSVNKVILVGNLGKDPEVRTTQDGTKIVNLTLATSENWTDRASGERKERTEWHRVVIFNDRIGEVAERYLRKGRKVYIEGSLQTRKWTDQSGPGALHHRGGDRPVPRRTGADRQPARRGRRDGRGRWRRLPAARPSTAAGGRQRGTSGGGSPSWDAPKGGDLDDEIPF